VRAARSLTEKVPKPTNATELPSFSEEVTAPVNASSARVAAALEISASVEIHFRRVSNSKLRFLSKILKN